MAQQLRELITLLTDMRFKWKEGTHKTLSKVISELNDMVPMEIIGAEEPVGELPIGIGKDSVLVKSVESKVMWSVAPLSKIQGLVNIELIEAIGKEDVSAAFSQAWILPEVWFGVIRDMA